MLEQARAAKYKLLGKNQWSVFKPADPRTQVSTLLCFDWLQERDLLEGTDYFEFGIFRGFNLWFVQAYAKARGLTNMRFAGFDSFFGLPPVEGIDAGGSFKEGGFSSYREEVETYYKRYGVDWDKTMLVQGFYEDSLNNQTIEKFKLRKCALCVIDCDLYSSTVSVLNFVAPLLADTSVLYFDDWIDFWSVRREGRTKSI